MGAEQNRIHQEKLFAQAQEDMAREQANNSNPNWNNSYYSNSNSNNSSYASCPQDDQSFLHQQENCINLKSAEKAKAFLSNHHQDDSSKLTFDKVFLVYKFNATQLKTLTSGMEAMNSLEQAKSYF